MITIYRAHDQNYQTYRGYRNVKTKKMEFRNALTRSMRVSLNMNINDLPIPPGSVSFFVDNRRLPCHLRWKNQGIRRNRAPTVWPSVACCQAQTASANASAEELASEASKVHRERRQWWEKGQNRQDKEDIHPESRQQTNRRGQFIESTLWIGVGFELRCQDLKKRSQRWRCEQGFVVSRCMMNFRIWKSLRRIPNAGAV